MKLSEIFRKSAILIDTQGRTLSGLTVDYSCEAISVAQNLYLDNAKTEAHILFHDFFKPEDRTTKEAYFGSIYEYRQDRAIALDLLAEILESKGK